MLSFKTMPHLLETPEGQAAIKDYLDLGKEILSYEKTLFENWKSTAADMAVQLLKNNILAFNPVAPDKKGKY